MLCGNVKTLRMSTMQITVDPKREKEWKATKVRLYFDSFLLGAGLPLGLPDAPLLLAVEVLVFTVFSGVDVPPSEKAKTHRKYTMAKCPVHLFNDQLV